MTQGKRNTIIAECQKDAKWKLKGRLRRTNKRRIIVKQEMEEIIADVG